MNIIDTITERYEKLRPADEGGGAEPTRRHVLKAAPAVAAALAVGAIGLRTRLVAAQDATPAASPVVSGVQDATPAATPTDGAIPAEMGARFDAMPAFADVAYADASDTQLLDIYLPEGDGPFPVVVNFHAGGFTFGDKGEVPTKVGNALLDAGYAVVGVGYRLFGEATFPAAVLDARAAVHFLRANADAYRLDPDRIAAFGQSAGENLAAMLGTTGDDAPFDDASLGNADVSNEVQLVIDWFGPTDFGQLDAQAKAQGCPAADQTYGSADSIAAACLGAPIGSVPELVSEANPITYLNGSEPPFLIQKGDQDCTVAIENTKMLADALSAAGVDVEYDLLAGGGTATLGRRRCSRARRTSSGSWPSLTTT